MVSLIHLIQKLVGGEFLFFEPKIGIIDQFYRQIAYPKFINNFINNLKKI